MTVLEDCAAAATIAAGVTATWELLRLFRRADKKLTEIHQDWAGTPERPGVPRRPGVMERLELIEVSQVDTRAEVADIKRALQRKGR